MSNVAQPLGEAWKKWIVKYVDYGHERRNKNHGAQKSETETVKINVVPRFPFGECCVHYSRPPVAMVWRN